MAVSKFEEGFYLAKLDATRTLICYNEGQSGLPVRFATRKEAEDWAVDMKIGCVILQVNKVTEVVPEMKVRDASLP